MIATISYDVGDLRSVGKVLPSLGETPVMTRDRRTILKVNKAILPGVRFFSDAMGKLKQYDPVDVICETVDQETPFLDICLGLQLLFAGNEESHGIVGLGIFPGKILKIPEHPGLETPHMSWNSLKTRPETKLFHGIEDGAYVCFVHSYYLRTEDESAVTAPTEYSTIIHASIERGNVFTCQPHPGKGGKMGLAIPKNSTGL